MNKIHRGDVKAGIGNEEKLAEERNGEGEEAETFEKVSAKIWILWFSSV